MRILRIFLLLLSISLLGCSQPTTTKPLIQSYESAFDIVPAEYRESVASSFTPNAKKIVLENNLHVFRYWGGKSKEVGRYYTNKMYADRETAIQQLALPTSNTVEFVSQIMIPAGTTVIYGGIANQESTPGFYETAIGGGKQYYILEPGVCTVELVGRIEQSQIEPELEEVIAQ